MLIHHGDETRKKSTIVNWPPMWKKQNPFALTWIVRSSFSGRLYSQFILNVCFKCTNDNRQRSETFHYRSSITRPKWHHQIRWLVEPTLSHLRSWKLEIFGTFEQKLPLNWLIIRKHLQLILLWLTDWNFENYFTFRKIWLLTPHRHINTTEVAELSLVCNRLSAPWRMSCLCAEAACDTVILFLLKREYTSKLSDTGLSPPDSDGFHYRGSRRARARACVRREREESHTLQCTFNEQNSRFQIWYLISFSTNPFRPDLSAILSFPGKSAK